MEEQNRRSYVKEAVVSYRKAEAKIPQGIKVEGAEDVAQAMSWLEDCAEERVYILHLDNRNRIIRLHLLSQGSMTASIIHPREVFCAAILAKASRLVMVHNHPSGHPTPSPEDIEITRRIKAAGDLLGIFLCDHVVIGDEGRYFSFEQEGVL